MSKNTKGPFELGLKNSVLTCLSRTHKSSLAEHSHNTKHPIKMDDMQVLTQVNIWLRRRMREAIEIVKNPNCLNRDDGLSISRSWLPNQSKLKNKN